MTRHSFASDDVELAASRLEPPSSPLLSLARQVLIRRLLRIDAQSLIPRRQRATCIRAAPRRSCNTPLAMSSSLTTLKSLLKSPRPSPASLALPRRPLRITLLRVRRLSSSLNDLLAAWDLAQIASGLTETLMAAPAARCHPHSLVTFLAIVDFSFGPVGYALNRCCPQAVCRVESPSPRDSSLLVWLLRGAHDVPRQPLHASPPARRALPADHGATASRLRCERVELAVFTA
ncbi:hypothetical protein B0H15DRAFT_951064 [Mycena belliarum]|uniref:Uncharacterized protein n=1 Tax=Mycena belliarum TaxID=1033014 RepID=A0AAD6XPM0_9AGAR|nr:hypothetical protein B0H15DRAFT_951064 [Mycena belliae]